MCPCLLLAQIAAAVDRFEEEPILYNSAEPDNPVSALQEAIDTTELSLTYDDQFGYLPSLLEALQIPFDSQLLVFSKTSFQNRRITPETPRAIYYNDDTYIGTVQRGEVIEVSTTDKNLGTVFYSLSQQKSDRVEFTRQTNNCLQCHASTLTRGIPGHVVRSVFPDSEGFPILKAGTHITTQSSPFEERWGGWYVTGDHGEALHMGNVIAKELDRDAEIDRNAGANRAELDARVDRSKYLTPHSDIVSHMVLLHQTKMHNLMTQANFETRFALTDQAVMDKILERDPDGRTASTLRRIANVGNKLVDYMLFVDEAELESRVKGDSTFGDTFPARGLSDSNGRTLRELDLETRLFRYPLSYLIYSEQFDALPPDALEFVYDRLWKVLSGEETDQRYAHLDVETRRAIVEIVLETKPMLPEYWKKL